MTSLVQGIGTGAGISRFSREIFDAYQLTAHGYRFANGTLNDCVSAFEQAVAEQRWVVVPLWQPQYLHWNHAIRELVESRGLLRGADEASLVLRKSPCNTLPKDLIDTLRTLTLGDTEITRLDYLVSREGMSPLAAGEQYLQNHTGSA